MSASLRKNDYVQNVYGTYRGWQRLQYRFSANAISTLCVCAGRYRQRRADTRTNTTEGKPSATHAVRAYVIVSTRIHIVITVIIVTVIVQWRRRRGLSSQSQKRRSRQQKTVDTMGAGDSLIYKGRSATEHR